MTHTHAETQVEQPAPTHWWQRAVPATVLAVAAGAAFVALEPSDEVRASTTRERQQYVELSVTATPDQICGSRRAVLPFRVVSHLEDGTPLRWRLGVDPEGPRPETVRARGVLTTRDGAAIERAVRTTAVPPKKAYDVTLRLPGRPEQLRVHCGGGR